MDKRQGDDTKLDEAVVNDKPADLTDWELEVVTKVFRSFETGLREGTILPKVGLVVFWGLSMGKELTWNIS